MLISLNHEAFLTYNPQLLFIICFYVCTKEVFSNTLLAILMDDLTKKSKFSSVKTGERNNRLRVKTRERKQLASPKVKVIPEINLYQQAANL